MRIIVELLPEFKEIEGDYEMVVEGRTNSLIKALVPVDQLGYISASKTFYNAVKKALCSRDDPPCLK